MNDFLQAIIDEMKEDTSAWGISGIVSEPKGVLQTKEDTNTGYF